MLNAKGITKKEANQKIKEEIKTQQEKSEELEEKYKSFAEQYKVDIEKIKEIVKEKDLLADIAAEKAVDFLRENCVSK